MKVRVEMYKHDPAICIPIEEERDGSMKASEQVEKILNERFDEWDYAIAKVDGKSSLPSLDGWEFIVKANVERGFYWAWGGDTIINL